MAILRRRLSVESLKKKCQDLKFDIKKFNAYVDEQRRALAARGGQAPDLLQNLFDVYKAVPDEEFKTYVTQKETAYEENKLNIQDTELMDFALAKFNTLQLKSEWKQPTPEQEEIVALKAEIAHLKSNKGPKKNQKKNPAPSPPTTTHSTGDSQATTKDKKKKRRGKKKDEDWVTKNPDNKTKMTRDGKEFIWCDHHKKWGSHTTAECKAKKKAAEEATVQPAVSLSATATGAVFGDDESTLSS